MRVMKNNDCHLAKDNLSFEVSTLSDIVISVYGSNCGRRCVAVDVVAV